MSQKSVSIEFDNVVKSFPGTSYNAVDGVSLFIEGGELVTILGTSGCGKTTLLKMINRIYEMDSGSIRIGGADIREGDPVMLRRKIGYVIQSIGLFPHMTVAGNIATVPKILGWGKAEIGARIDELLDLVGLEPGEFRGRYPAQLSGGQQQRVGLVRALAADPEIMLLDEPFGAIDAINRVGLQQELVKIHQSEPKTYLFVTHDIVEAFSIGTRVMIMDEGRVQQYDTPHNIVANPANDFVKSILAPALQAGEVFKAGVKVELED